FPALNEHIRSELVLELSHFGFGVVYLFLCVCFVCASSLERFLRRSWDAEAGTYKYEFIDKNTGCANALHFIDKDGKDIIVGTNREINEVAYYTLTE
ncbi:MAG: hypothetical protein II189_02875, partial [Lachnospiraceae bacterium]|nr:hypothetical protein [Lachnospiraceae bacterium]